MTTYSFYYFHNHYSTPLITGLKLPFGIKAKEIEQIPTGLEKAIVLLALTGQTDKLTVEEQHIKDILSTPKNTYLIITPFNFESGVDLDWVHWQLKILQSKNINFEPLELDSLLKNKPHLTFDEAFQEIQKVIELIASTTFGTFRG